MKFKLVEIMGMQRGLSTLIKMQLPIRLSYKLSKLFNLCSKELIAIEEARSNLVKKYSKEIIETPGEYKVELKNEDTFREEFNIFLEEETEFDFIPIRIDDFEGVKISPFDLSGLFRIIDDS